VGAHSSRRPQPVGPPRPAGLPHHRRRRGRSRPTSGWPALVTAHQP